MSTLGIILGVVVMFISLSILIGFRLEIQNKIIGFGSHIQISKISSSQSAEPEKIVFDQQLVNDIKRLDNVEHIQIYATKGALIENKEELEGILVKGVSEDFQWDFIESNLEEGRSIQFSDTSSSNEIIISRILADLLELEIDQKVSIYFINSTEDFRYRKLKVVGIYSTDLAEFDNQQVFADIKHIRAINNWGLEAQLLILDSLPKGFYTKALAFGGDQQHTFSWNIDLQGAGPHFLQPEELKKEIYVVVNDGSNTISDTAFVTVDMSGSGSYNIKNYTSNSSSNYYIGGYEVLLADIDRIEQNQMEIDDLTSYDLVSDNFKDLNSELFSWLEMIGVNAKIIIILMIIVAMINMTSTIIIIILERTQLIGLMKALGSSDWSIRRMFLFNASKMILKGIAWGNLIALSLLWFQKKFQFIKLNADSYSLSEVPVALNFKYFLLLDLAVFLICILVLLIPSWIITFISPVKALRYE